MRLELTLLAVILLMAALPARANGQPEHPTRIVFLRHADTARDSRGQYIEAFTPKGLAQVAALPDKLAGVLGSQRFDAVIVSPQWRAKNTIRAWLQAQGLSAEIWPELDETSWDRQSTQTTPQADQPIRIAADEAALFHVRAANFGGLGPEYGHAMQLRAASAEAGLQMARFAAELLRKRWDGQGVNLLVVGHYHSGGRLLELLQSGTAQHYDPAQPRYRTGNTGLHVLVQSCAEEGYVLTRYDDGALYAGQNLPEASPDYAGACR